MMTDLWHCIARKLTSGIALRESLLDCATDCWPTDAGLCKALAKITAHGTLQSLLAVSVAIMGSWMGHAILRQALAPWASMPTSAAALAGR